MKGKVFIFIAEVPPNLSKISANREKHKMKGEVFIFIAEAPPNLSKNRANQEKNEKLFTKIRSFLVCFEKKH